MRRDKPSPLQFACWAAALRFKDAAHWPARGLYLHWRDFAEARRVQVGSPRAFSNALRRLGCPVERGADFDCPRRRCHLGVRPELQATDAESHAWAYDRYHDGEDVHAEQHRAAAVEAWRQRQLEMEERLAAEERRLELRIRRDRARDARIIGSATA